MYIILLILIIVTLQSIAVFIDNYAVFNLLSEKISLPASKLAKKGQLEFLCRGFLFLCPPFLGLLLFHKNFNALLFTFLLSSFVSLIITFWQYIYHKEKFIHSSLIGNKVTIKKNLFFLIFGICVYFIHLYAHFFLNILGFVFPNHNVWILQFTPAISSLSTAFVVYYLDPKIAKYIDRRINSIEIFNEIIIMRVFGRLLLFIFSLFLFFNLIYK